MEHDPSREDWSELFGQKFEPGELTDARDMRDIVMSYGCPDDMLESFVREDGLKTGQRLFLAMNMPPDQLGVICLREDDDRIMKVAKARCGDLNREADGRSMIVMPGEEAPEAVAVAEQPRKRPSIIIP
jgi:hypothetical protein